MAYARNVTRLPIIAGVVLTVPLIFVKPVVYIVAMIHVGTTTAMNAADNSVSHVLIAEKLFATIVGIA